MTTLGQQQNNDVGLSWFPSKKIERRVWLCLIPACFICAVIIAGCNWDGDADTWAKEKAPPFTRWLYTITRSKQARGSIFSFLTVFGLLMFFYQDHLVGGFWLASIFCFYALLWLMRNKPSAHLVETFVKSLNL